MTNQWIIALTAGKWQLDGILTAKKMGFSVLGIDASDNAVGLNHCDKAIVVDIKDRAALIAAIKKSEVSAKAVLPFCSEVGMLPSAWIREEFKIEGLDVNNTLKMLHKHEQRKIWKDAGVESLKWHLASTLEEAENAARQIGLPLMIKPIDSSGSRGVSKIESFEEIKVSFQKAIAASKAGKILVEEFLDGTEYTVEAYTSDHKSKILAVTEKTKVEGSRGTVASELAYPSISPDLIEKIKSHVLKAIEAIGYQNGPTHTEVILTKSNQVGLVEMAARGGGFGVFSKLIPLASGINVTEVLVKQIMGEKIDVEDFDIQNNLFSLKFFPVTKNGIVKTIKGIGEANKIGRSQVESFVEIGQEVSNDFCDGNRLGYILAAGSTMAEIKDNIRTIESMVSFEIQ